MDPAQPILVGPEAPRLPEPFYAVPQYVPRQRLWLHALLFALTIASTMVVGGAVYSVALLLILTAHEFGHYLTARRHGVPASLPYFVPLPIPPFGTLGAVIRMSPRIPNRRVLFDIAAAGPLAGLVLAIPLAYVGIVHSTIVPKAAMQEHTLTLAEPLLFKGLEWLSHGQLGNGLDLMLNPLAYAGWVGLFITALNLIPIGQLDGGHIVHALFGRRSRWVAGAMFTALGLYSIVEHIFNWVPLLVLLLLFGVQHPPTMDDEYPLDGTRRAIGALLAMVFLTCFSLVPLKI